MPETPRYGYESGETVNTVEELLEAIYGKPRGFKLQINALWEEHRNIWAKIEQLTGQKVAIRISNTTGPKGKQTCLLEFEVI